VATHPRHPANFSGKFYQSRITAWLKKSSRSLRRLEKLANETKPAMYHAGASAYPRTLDFSRLRHIADAAGLLS